MYQLDDESIEMLSELDLLYSHYLELNDMLEVVLQWYDDERTLASVSILFS